MGLSDGRDAGNIKPVIHGYHEDYAEGSFESLNFVSRSSRIILPVGSYVETLLSHVLDLVLGLGDHQPYPSLP